MILDRIARDTRVRVETCKERISFEEMKAMACEVNRPIGSPFEEALQRFDINFICEVKKASPSKGVISQDFPYLKIAKEYEEAKASAISVLTEPNYFLGSDRYLSEIGKVVHIPLLRKDFTIDEYQIYEARTIGASAILLICALLDTKKIYDFLLLCDELGLSAVVEAHDKKEIESALAAGAKIIGVNNRNLNDFTVDIQNSINLRKLVPPHILFIAESGIKTAKDIEMLRQSNVNGVLVGEALMRSENKIQLLEELRGNYI